jgi:hypothetical protein
MSAVLITGATALIAIAAVIDASLSRRQLRRERLHRIQALIADSTSRRRRSHG